MAVVIKLIGISYGRTEWDGQYVVEYNPDDPTDPRWVLLKTTPDRSKAKQFKYAYEAMEYWRQQSVVEPLRPDGKPNRPLTAFTVELRDYDE